MNVESLNRNRLNHRYIIYSNNPENFFGILYYDWRKSVFQGIADYLRLHGLDVIHEPRESFEVNWKTSRKRKVTTLDSMAVMQNDQTGDYFVLDCDDRVKPKELMLFARDDQCKRILKCQYRSTAFKDAVYHKIHPWTYFDRFWPKNEKKFIESRKSPRTSNSLYFRGTNWLERGKILEELIRREVISPDFQNVGYLEYIREILDHRLILSLPRCADICNRDIEGFASGTCILRPKAVSEFHNELIADVHYVSVDMDIRQTDPVIAAEKIEQRFREVVDDHTYLASVAENAGRWYDENVRRDAAMQLTATLLGFR